MINDVLIGADQQLPRALNVTALLHRRAVFGFGALLLLTIPAFWRSYFFPPKIEPAVRVHVHGIAMFMWLILLVTQATLIRKRSPPLHRAVGTASYVLFPVIFVSTLSVAVFVVTQIPTFIIFRMPWWPRFAEWYAALPLF